VIFWAIAPCLEFANVVFQSFIGLTKFFWVGFQTLRGRFIFLHQFSKCVLCI